MGLLMHKQPLVVITARRTSILKRPVFFLTVYSDIDIKTFNRLAYCSAGNEYLQFLNRRQKGKQTGTWEG